MQKEKNKSKKKIIVYDVTLRDGWQDPRKNLAIDLKHRVYNVLKDFRPHYIEACWPSSSIGDMEFIKQVVKQGNPYSKIVAFGSTANPRNKAKDDRNLNDIISTGADVATIFGKTWDVHIENQLRISLEENIELIKNSVKYLRENGMEVIYDAEHFFSGWKAHPDYAFDCLKAAIESGATTIVLCDTKGACLPKDIRKVVKQIYERFGSMKDITWGIHCHNDSGLATANSVEFIEEILQYFDKVHIQGTINGMGERCGNGDLCEVLPNLEDKYGYKTGLDIGEITMISRRVADITGIDVPQNQPYVGKLAFAHKGGAHVDAIRKGATYLHTDPARWGNSEKIIDSNQSGKANIMSWIDEFCLQGIDKKDIRIADMLARMRELSEMGYDIGCSKAEKLLLVDHFLSGNPASYLDIEDFNTSEIRAFKKENGGKRDRTILRGYIYYGSKKQKFEDVATSEHGPVDSQKKVLIKVLGRYYPEVNDIRLVDYLPKISKEIGSESYMRVPIKLTDGKETWETIGVSDSIIEASLEALYKGFIYKLIKDKYRNH